MSNEKQLQQMKQELHAHIKDIAKQRGFNVTNQGGIGNEIILSFAPQTPQTPLKTEYVGQQLCMTDQHGDAFYLATHECRTQNETVLSIQDWVEDNTFIQLNPKQALELAMYLIYFGTNENLPNEIIKLGK